MNIIINKCLTNTYIDGRLLAKFKNILPKDVFIYILMGEFDLKYQTQSYILYVSNNIILFGTKNTDYTGLVGYIEFVIDIIEDECSVSFIHIEEEYRGFGVSVFLFILMSNLLLTLGINKVTLDDDSDQAWKLPNVYIKLGMKYINEKPESEMEGRTLDIKNKWNKQYFIDKGFFTSIKTKKKI